MAITWKTDLWAGIRGHVYVSKSLVSQCVVAWAHLVSYTFAPYKEVYAIFHLFHLSSTLTCRLNVSLHTIKVHHSNVILTSCVTQLRHRWPCTQQFCLKRIWDTADLEHS